MSIFFQVGTIIGPGTIFLMLVGAFVAAFKISNWVSFYYNLIPIVVYTGTCLLLKPKWQLGKVSYTFSITTIFWSQAFAIFQEI